jgi:hypothetical protein
MLRQLIEELLPLSWDQRLMGRLNGYDDLNRAILRCCTLLSRESVGAILATCIQSPALGSEFVTCFSSACWELDRPRHGNGRGSAAASF